MRLLAWNIQAGGKSRIPRIAAVIIGSSADILVLSEVRKSSQNLYDRLRSIGYGDPITCIAHREFNGKQVECGAIALLSRLPMKPVTVEAPASPVSRERWVEREIPAAGVSVVGLYVLSKERTTRDSGRLQEALSGNARTGRSSWLAT